MDRVHQKGQQPAKELGEGYIILTPSINNELLGDLLVIQEVGERTQQASLKVPTLISKITCPLTPLRLSPSL